MIDVKYIYEILKNNNINFFTGVPDSLLKDFCAYVTENSSNKNHIIAANEGGAIGIATGYHLSTGNIPLVYLQNSGLGNCINPLLSIADKEVYGVPMILMIGWRGEPLVKDEPQHIKQGRVQNLLLDNMEIPYRVIDQETSNIEEVIKDLIDLSLSIKNPVAIVVKKDTFTKYKMNDVAVKNYEMSREEAIEIILDHLSDNTIIVSTTGMISREVFEQREFKKQSHNRDFLTVGAMGHCSQIALGVSLNTNMLTVCIDGDGSLIMHLGSLPIVAQNSKNNFLHIVLNNSAHDSVGGQPTIANSINLDKIADNVGYNSSCRIEKKNDLINKLKTMSFNDGPSFIEVRVKKGARNDLGRPTTKPIENKLHFMQIFK